MASNAQIKGITIKITGDTSDLAKSLGSVNKELNETKKALKDVEAGLKLDPTNVELLEQKQALLTKQIEETKQKLELEREAAEQAKHALEIGSISQEEYATLTAEIVKTESSLSDLQAQAEGSADSISQTGAAASEAGSEVDSSKSSFVDWGAVVSSAASIAVSAIESVVSVIADASTALADMTRETANYADDVLTLSQTSGVAVETLQALQYGEDLLDVSTSTVSSAMTRLTRAMGNAQDETGSYNAMVDELNQQLQDGQITAEEYAEAIQGNGTAFTNLGVEILNADGSLRDSEDVFWDVIDALGNISNEAERDAAAMDIMGRSARELNPLIEAGSEGFAAVAAEAEAAGAIMGGETLREFQGFDDTLSRLDQGAEAAKRALGSILLPVLDELAGEGVSLINDFTNGILDANGDIDQMGAVIETAVNSINEILQGDLVGNIIEIGGTIIQTLASAIMDNLDSILSAGFSLIMTVAQGLVDNLSSLAPVAADMIVQLARFIVDNLPTVIDAAIQIIVAVVDGIARSLPELIPAAVECVTQVATALIDNIDLLIPAALELVIGIAMGLVAAIPDLVAVIPQLVEAIANEMVDLADSLANAAMTWGADLIQGFIDGLMGSIGNLVGSLESVAGTIADYLSFSVPDKGPLHEWAFNNPGADMVDLFTDGMESQDAVLQRSLYQTAGIIYNGMTTDYSGQLNGISDQLGALAGGGSSGPQIINLYVGQNRIGSVVVNALDTEYYLSGGN